MASWFTEQVGQKGDFIEKLKLPHTVSLLIALGGNKINQEVTGIAHQYFGKIIGHGKSFSDKLGDMFVSLVGVHFDVIEELNELGFD